MKKLSLFLSALFFSMIGFATEVTYDFKQAPGFSSWGSSYEKHVVTYDDATVTFEKANKQPAGNTIDDCPVTKGQPVSVVYTKAGVTLSEASFECKQWASKAQTITLHYSTDGGATYTSTGVTATNFTISSTLPEGTNAVKITFSSSSNQVGIVSCTLVTSETEDPNVEKFTVTANVNDETMGSVNGAGEYSKGETATLTAVAKTGYEFVNWSNGSTDNPLKFEVTENVELTANFQAQTPVTIAEALVLADGAACVLNPVTVVYVSGSYIYIEDESAYALAYKYNYGLVAGDKVTGLAITKSTYNGIAQFTPASAYADLTIAAGEAPAIDELTSAPTVADNHLVKLMNVKMEGEFTTSTSGTLVATCADETTINIYNNKVNAYTFVADKTYNIIGGVTQYKNVIQIQAYEIEEYVAPATETVYFVNAQNWGAVNAYVWDADGNNGGAWPGVAATKEAEQIGGYDVYSYTAEAGAFVNVIFNDGSGTQTSDLVWEADKYYVIDGWYTKEEAEAKLAAPIADIWTVAGAPATVFGTEWDPANAENNMTLQEDGTYKWEKADLTLAASNIQFKVAKNNSWGEAYPGGNYDLPIAEAGIYTITITFNPSTKEVVGTATKTGSAVVIPTIAIAGDMNGWNTTANEFVVAADELTATLTLSLEAQDYGFKMIIAGGWTSDGATITRENNTVVFTGANGDNSTLTADVAGEYTFTWTYATNTLVVTYPEKPAIEWIEMPLEISNLTTMEMPVEGVTYLQLTGRDDMNDADVMLFLNNYTGEEKAYEVNAESSLMTFGGLELTVMDGSITKSVDPELGDVYAGIVHASVEEDGVAMYVAFDLKMYALAPIAIELEDVEIVVNEESAIAFFNATWEGSPLQVEVSGFEEVEFKEYPECWLSIGDDVNWVDAAAGPAAIIIEDGVAMLEGEFTSFSTGKTYEVMLSGKLPVKEEPVVEPTYTENQLNTFAFGLESELNDTALVVKYRLNNSNATSVNVLVYKGEKLVATVAGTTTIGVNTVAIPVANLPKGRMLTWSVEVNGTSVEVPTQESKIYSFYHPSGLDIDNNPENPTFGMLLINEGMQAVKGETGYVSSGFGAGIFAFTPSLDLIPNGDQPGYNGGIEFTTGRADGAGTAYSPRRIRISEDGRIFVTSLNTDGNYLWEVNPENLNEWTSVFQGTLNENKELIDADSNFVAAPNNGFDVKGSGENLQLAMYSVNLPGITGAAMSGFRLHEYNLGTATTWATAPSKAIVEGKYAINYTGTQVEYDNEGGLWIASYRGTANDVNPGLVHINADGVEDAKLVWSNVRQAGIRFNNDFTKLVVAGNNGAAKKATIYSVSKDANGAPVLTEETVIDMAAVGNNLNDFAFDYAGNLYACGNSAEKLIGWAMPYSGQVVTPAASKYAFHIGELLPDPVVVTEMAGVVKRALQNGENTIVLTHETDGTPHIYEVANGTILELLQNGVIAVDPENAGDLLAISDIALTEDGKLVATNYMQTQSGDDYVDAGYKRGETRIYIWNDLHDAPSILFTSKMSSNWFRSKQGLTMAVKGTSDNMEIFMTGIHATKAWARVSSYRVINGVYEEPAVNHNDHYFFYDVADAVALETTVGTQYELTASPLGAMNWILDAELINPVEIVEPETNNVEISSCVALSTDLGKKYNGTSIVTVGEQHLMVAPYADAEGKLAGVKVLDITAGLDAATEVATANLDATVEATAAATAVEVVEGDEATALLITLVADATLHTLEVVLEEKPNYMLIEDAITNLVIDLESMAIIGGPSTMWQVEVFLGLGQDNGDGTFTLTEESSVAIMGFDARFIDGYAYDIDVNAPAAKAVLHVEDSGFFYEIKLDMTSTPQEAVVIVIENALVQVDTIPLFGDAVDYALKMSANWTNEADGVTYPVLVEVPVYYPEATEPSEMTCTVTIGGEGDNDPWLGFGEGPLTITTVGDIVTAKGIVSNPYTGVAFDITISGPLPIISGTENVKVNAKPVKMIKNGQLIIIKNDKEYNVLGATVK